MAEQQSSIYQSGQSVPTPGTYEAVGVDQAQAAAHKKEPAVRELQAGELFPNYDGRAISWRLLRKKSAPPTVSTGAT